MAPNYELADCPTNTQVWSEEDWQGTVWQDLVAPKGDLLALNAFGELKLFDVSDARKVKQVGSLKLPETDLALNSFPLAWADDDTIVQTYDSGVFVINVKTPAKPKLEKTLTFIPKGYSLNQICTIAGGFLYGTWSDHPIAVDLDTGKSTDFESDLTEPSALFVTGETLVVVGSEAVAVHPLEAGIPGAAGKPLKLKNAQSCHSESVAVLPGPDALFALISRGGSLNSLTVLDLSDPRKPVAQKQCFKPEAMGMCVQDSSSGSILVAHGEMDEQLLLTEVTLDKAGSKAGKPVLLTEDPELTQGVTWLRRGKKDELLVLGHTGRFALFTRKK